MGNKLMSVAALALLACSCSTGSRTPSDLKPHTAAIQQHVDSFKGLSMERVRARLANSQLSEEEWQAGAFGGRQLVATFPDYQIRVLFSGDEVVTTSFQILSK